MKVRIFCTIPQDLIQRPLMFTLVDRFGVVPNIRGASVTETIALLSIDLEGDEEKVAAAMQFLRDEGVQVEVQDEDEPASA